MRLTILILSFALLASGTAWPQSYPSKPVRWIVSLPPGGSTDLISRMLAQKLAEAWQEVPTISEDGVSGYEVSVWYGVMMPAVTPNGIITRVNADIVRILVQPDMNEHLSADAGEVVAGTPDAVGAFIRADTARWTKVVTATGVKAE